MRPMTVCAKFGASSSTMFADLPPSSRNTRFSVAAPFSMMRLPTAVEPVKEIRSTRGSVTSISPAMAGSARSDDVEHAGREAGFDGQFAHDRAHQRRVRRGLQDDGAAGEQRCDDLADVDVERHVPGRDRADDADGFVRHEALGVEAIVVARRRDPLPTSRAGSIRAAHPCRPARRRPARGRRRRWPRLLRRRAISTSLSRLAYSRSRYFFISSKR